VKKCERTQSPQRVVASGSAYRAEARPSMRCSPWALIATRPVPLVHKDAYQRPFLLLPPDCSLLIQSFISSSLSGSDPPLQSLAFHFLLLCAAIPQEHHRLSISSFVPRCPQCPDFHVVPIEKASVTGHNHCVLELLVPLHIVRGTRESWECGMFKLLYSCRAIEFIVSRIEYDGGIIIFRLFFRSFFL
jgi:hypothetical protein